MTRGLGRALVVIDFKTSVEKPKKILGRRATGLPKANKGQPARRLTLHAPPQTMPPTSSSSQSNAPAPIGPPTPPPTPPNAWCVCRKSSFGRMIACDSDKCSIVWYHMPCIGMKIAPKNKWMCSKCKQ